MVFTEIVVDVYNYSNPVSFEDRHYAMSMLGAGSAKTNSVNIKKVEIETDYGFFFEDRQKVTGAAIDTITRDISPSEMYGDAAAVILTLVLGTLIVSTELMSSFKMLWQM